MPLWRVGFFMLKILVVFYEVTVNGQCSGQFSLSVICYPWSFLDSYVWTGVDSFRVNVLHHDNLLTAHHTPF